MADMGKLKFPIICLVLQVLLIILYGIGGKYGPHGGKPDLHVDADKLSENPSKGVYPYFTNIHVMIFVGFGFLMSFLKRYGYSGVGYTLIISALVIQWSTVVNGLWSMLVMEGTPADHWGFSIGFMAHMDFATATVLISFGAVLGKTGPTQLLIMGLVETVFSQVNKWLGLAKLHIQDSGESMFIHTFGAYFGLAVSRMLHNEHTDNNKKGTASYQGDIVAMIGTLFLWVYWPSFNGALAGGLEQERAVLNTYYSLAACTVVAVALSLATDPHGKLTMAHIQNATLAGGVAMGTAAQMPLGVWMAALVGAIAGILSILGYRFVQPALAKMNIHDTCGVHNLHGLPGVWAAVVGAVGAALVGYDGWYQSMYIIFPAMIPEPYKSNGEWHHFNKTYHPVARTGGEQAGYQLLGLIITIIMATVAGLITGAIMKLPLWDSPSEEHMYDDNGTWHVEEGMPIVHHEQENAHHELDAKA